MRQPTTPTPPAVALGLRVRDAPPRRGVGHSLDTACKSATRRRGLTQGSGSAPGRTHAVSACATRATRLARTRKRALSLVAHQCKLSRTACDRSGTRRVGRARRGDAGRPCLANACEEGPQGHARAEPAAQVPWAAPQPMAVVRACWTDGRPARRPRGIHDARLSSRRGPPRRPRALGRPDGATGERKLRADARCWDLFRGIKKTGA